MRIIVIGCGNIGYRHLQAICSLEKIVSEVYVVEPNAERLDSIVHGPLRPNFKGKIFGFCAIENLLKEISHADLLISAVTADKQLQIISELGALPLANILLEKPLAQSLDDLLILKKKLNERKRTKVFVNCPMPLWSFYKELKSFKTGPLNMSFSGSNWGFGCNSIHYIELFRTLTDSSQLSIVQSSLKPSPFSTKRGQAYEEFLGSCSFQNNNGDLLHLSCSASSALDVSISGTIRTPESYYIIDECINRGYEFTKNKSIDIGVLYVSQSTALFLDSLQKGNLLNQLPTFDQAEISHKVLFEVLELSLDRAKFRIT